MTFIYIGIYILLVLIVLFLGYTVGTKNIHKFMESATVLPKQELYRKILSITKKVLDDLEIPFFLSSGTCLGYVRERDFINHDYDLDIGILEENYNPDLINKLQDQGLLLYRVFGTIHTGIELSFYLPHLPGYHRLRMSIFIYRSTTSQYRWYSYEPTGQQKVEYNVSKFQLKEVDFLGLKVNIPDSATTYLKELYGKDWRIPKIGNILTNNDQLFSEIHTRDTDLWLD